MYFFPIPIWAMLVHSVVYLPDSSTHQLVRFTRPQQNEPSVTLWRVSHAYLVTGLPFHGATCDDIVVVTPCACGLSPACRINRMSKVGADFGQQHGNGWVGCQTQASEWRATIGVCPRFAVLDITATAARTATRGLTDSRSLLVYSHDRHISHPPFREADSTGLPSLRPCMLSRVPATRRRLFCGQSLV